MGDRMRTIPFGDLLEWMMKEYREEGKVFGLQKNKFYISKDKGRMGTAFGVSLGSGTGPAAGPHTQLAQNILTAYLAGGRFIELKTVQKLDGEFMREAIAKPCINAEDEGYNVEWSTELKVEEAQREYIKAWLLCHVAMKEFGISDERDFAFNMSVGYDLDGIKTEKIDSFIEGLKDARKVPFFSECLETLREKEGLFESFKESDIDGISPVVCTTLALSTLHGCPAQEIERIATYLLEEKGINLFIKCNPTLLGYEYARDILDSLGYGYLSFDEHHFKEDLQFDEAVAMLKRLMEKAEAKGLICGVKLTNTFPVRIERKELPGEEMYMSGRSLLPLSIGVARKLGKAFEGSLPMAFSGGADALNMKELLDAGIQPVTVCTTLLKPGGYARLNQIAATTAKKLEGTYKGIDPLKLEALSDTVLKDERLRKDFREGTLSRKTGSKLPVFDCFKAPCKGGGDTPNKDGGCPLEQNIPEYLKLAGRGDFGKAFSVIFKDNPSPSILGNLCSHPCQSHCTRVDYDKTLQIRSMKKLVSDNAQESFIEGLGAAAPRSGKKALVIGAGPAGMSCALFLQRNGIRTVVFEKEEKAYGQVRYLIPGFRISDDAIDRDFSLAEKLGVEFRFNCGENHDLKELSTEYDYVVVATGPVLRAEGKGELEGRKTSQASEILRAAKAGTLKAEGRVLVAGNGFQALDAARVLKREEKVTSVAILGSYGENADWVPFDEKAQLSLEGIGFVDTIEEAGSIDLIVNGDSFPARYAGKPEQNNVFYVGECRTGSGAMVNASADGKACAREILRREGIEDDMKEFRLELKPMDIYIAKGALRKSLGSKEEGNRCLRCHDICEICTEVCPNRANVAIEAEGFGNLHQIVHIDGMCNECGNCTFFCPHSGEPYRDKFTVFWTKEDFMDSKNTGILKAGSTIIYRDTEGDVLTFEGRPVGLEPKVMSIISSLLDKYPHYLLDMDGR